MAKVTQLVCDEAGIEPSDSVFTSYLPVRRRPELRLVAQTSAYKTRLPWSRVGPGYSLEEVLWLLEDLLTSRPLADTICQQRKGALGHA